MNERRSTRKWINLLKRVPGTRHGKDVLDEPTLWAAHEKLSTLVAEMSDSAQRMTTVAMRERSSLDLAREKSHLGITRLETLDDNLRNAGTIFERLALVALNASLESTRHTDAVAQALHMVGEDVRSHALRGHELTKELQNQMKDSLHELSLSIKHSDAVKEGLQNLSVEGAKVGSASADAEKLLLEVRDQLRAATGTDPETLRTMAEASEHARALVVALGRLSGRVPEQVVATTLKPVLDAISRLTSPPPSNE